MSYSKKTAQTFLILAIVLVFPFIAKAEEPAVSALSSSQDEEMMLFKEIPSVYGASKYEQKVTEAPSSVSIVTASDIKKYGYRTLADILRSVRSLYVTYDRNYSYVGVRGFGRPGDYNDRILLLVDGHRTNDNIYDQAYVGTDFILDVDLIDRIEIIRGPGSSLYGSNAFFAVINVITRRGRGLKGTEVSGSAGRYDTYEGRASYGDRYRNGVEALASGTYFNSKGQSLYYQEFDPAYSTDPRATNGGVTNHTDYDRFRSFFTKDSFRDFTLEAAYSSRTKGIPTGAFGTDYNDPGNKTIDTRGYADLKYEHSLDPQTELSARLFFDYYEYYGDYVYSGVPNKDWVYGEWWGSEVKITSRLWSIHRVILGAEYTDNLRQDQKNYDAAPSYALYLDDRRRSQIWAVYAQDEFAFPGIRNMLVNAGLRLDHYDTFNDTYNPRAALIYNPVEASTFKILGGTAFRAPNVFELYYVSPTNMSNPDLKPEKIQTGELVYEYRNEDHFRATATGYYYRIKDLINQTEAMPGVTMFRNIDQVEARGLEVELEKKWASAAEGRISYTVQRAVDKQTGSTLTNSPGHLAKLNITVPLAGDVLFASIEEQHTGKRKTNAGDYARDFYSTNLTLYSRRLMKGFELSASVYNLFDVKYGDPVSSDLVQNTIQQDGRMYRVKLTYAF